MLGKGLCLKIKDPQGSEAKEFPNILDIVTVLKLQMFQSN